MRDELRQHGPLIMGGAGFATLIDLFAPQAIVPSLARALDASVTVAGTALNCSVIGMAVAGLLASLFIERLGRKVVISGTLMLLGVPTALLSIPAGLVPFALLRIAQGVLMAVNFAVCIAFVAEEWGSSGRSPTVMAAYVAGNVGGQVAGRLMMGLLAQYLDWRSGFLVLAAVNGAYGFALWHILADSRPDGTSLEPITVKKSAVSLWPIFAHLGDSRLCAAFSVGFLILFSFIGAFTYINFYLIEAFHISIAAIGKLYLSFSVAVLATPLAGLSVRRLGYPTSLAIGGSGSLTGVALTSVADLPMVVTGIALTAAGLFFSQAVTTSFVGNTARHFKAVAGGLYLAAYYVGGIVGSVLFGLAFTRWGWSGCALLIGSAILLMMIIGGTFWRCLALGSALTLGQLPLARAQGLTPLDAAACRQISGECICEAPNIETLMIPSSLPLILALSLQEYRINEKEAAALENGWKQQCETTSRKTGITRIQPRQP